MYPEQLSSNKKQIWTHKDSFQEKYFNYVQAFIHKDYEIGMHSHDFYEVNIVLSGTGAHYVDNRIYEVKRGNVFVIPPNTNHGYYQDGKLNVYHILIHNLFTEHYMEELESLPAYMQLFNIEPMIRQNTENGFFIRLSDNYMDELYGYLEVLLKLSDKKECESEVAKNFYAMFIITQLCHYYTDTYKSVSKNRDTAIYRQFMRSIEMIHSEYSRKLTIDELASYMHICRSTYIKLFNQILNKPPLQYILKYRISKAKTLLTKTQLSITEIAQKTGFYDSSHLTKTFLVSENITPKEFRKRKRA